MPLSFLGEYGSVLNLKARKKIDSFALSASDYEQDLVELAIAQEAWQHVISKDYLIVGVCTAEMGKRLKALGFRLEQIFDLSEIINDPEKWEQFTQEIFHHGLRLL